MAAPAAKDSAPEQANEYVQRAVSLYEKGQLDAAIAEYRRGIKNDPLDSDTWYGLAELLHEMGHEKQALDTYATALTVIEHAPELRLPYAELLVANKKRDDAMKVLQRGIELDPDFGPELKAMLGSIAVGALDDAPAAETKAEHKTLVSASGAKSNAPAAAAATSAKSKAKAAAVQQKRKKLCRRFCADNLSDIVKP